MLNLAVVLEDSARTVPDRVAVVCGPTRLSYAELDAKASQVAGALAARGIAPGDRVALSCPNLPYFPIVYYGILKAGATVVPLNILLTEREIAYHLILEGYGLSETSPVATFNRADRPRRPGSRRT